MWTSNDGITYTVSGTPPIFPGGGIVRGLAVSSTAYAVDDTGVARASSNGVQWPDVFSVPSVSAVRRSLLLNGGKWMYTIPGPGPRYYSSSDLVSYTGPVTIAGVFADGEIGPSVSGGLHVATIRRLLSAPDAQIATSPDLITWTASAAAGVFYDMRQSILFKGLWVVCGMDGGTGNGIIASLPPDLTGWTLRHTRSIAGAYLDMATDGNVVVAVGAATDIAVSADGVAWSDIVLAGTMQSVAYSVALGLFVAVGNGGTVFTSPDGFAWTLRITPTADPLTIVTA
jgi:hypothetical protein